MVSARPFSQLNLHTVTKDDLNFSKRFAVTLKEDIDALDGWVIWFDIFFATSRDGAFPGQASSTNNNPADHHQLPTQCQPKESEQNNDDHSGVQVSFTTGPFGPATHWKQAVLLINHGPARARALPSGSKILGEIDYHKPKKESRNLEIGIKWQTRDVDDAGPDTASGKVEKVEAGNGNGNGAIKENGVADRDVDGKGKKFGDSQEDQAKKPSTGEEGRRDQVNGITEMKQLWFMD